MQVTCRNADHGDRLRAAGLRRTQARQAVLAALTSAGRPMTHQQLASARGLKVIDKVTIYRTLTTLRAARLLHVVRGADGTARFCANGTGSGCPGGHPHFQCLRCKEMRCMHEQCLPRVALDKECVVRAKQLVVFGMCAACASPAAAPAGRRHRRCRRAR